MKTTFRFKLVRWLAAANIAAGYALTSSLCYAQQATPTPSPAPSPAVAASADGKEAKKPVAQPSPTPPAPRFKLYGWIQGGFTGNPDNPVDNHNFGQLYTDRSNEPVLNQVSVVAERDLDPSVTGFDWGFKGWFMYGADTRYSKSLGLLDDTTSYILQPDFPEVSASIHIPIPGTNGLDVKGGKYQDPMSAETLDPRTNVFYSHSYIYTFGVPVSDTGGLATLHVNNYLDLYAGVNRGANMSLADNNASVAFEGGIGLNLLGGNLTTLALTNAGPPNPGDNHNWGYFNDITTTWKVTKDFTSITDLNLVVNGTEGGKWGGGVAQYFTYSLNDWLQLGFRGEIFRDSGGFFVVQYRDNNDYLHIALQGRAVPFDPSDYSGGDTTYLELTWGVTLKPPMPKPVQGLLIRPEVRYDQALTTAFKPFDDATKRNQVTLAVDAVLEF
jgi:Putative beta-barrel porin-2, OmpL-like. bbp2